MQTTINKPIFIVGSPRSGTSILTWCLGQHPNIFPVDESTGIGELALALAVCYQTKMGLGPDSLWSAMNLQRGEFIAAFGQTINELIQRHKVDLERKWWKETFAPNVPPIDFVAEKATNLTKTRWVDGTPAYSFHICGLRKLFPNALFIHIVRDVSSVVRSMLLFQRVSGRRLAANEQEAYNYWLRTVSSCLLAERAYGPRVVLRLRHSDLVNEPEAAFRSLLNFLGEPYTPECLEPLAQRINSSNVPADFDGSDPQTDPAVVEKALQVSTEPEKDSKFVEPSAVATDEIETAFDQRARDVSQLKEEGKAKDLLVLRLQKEFDERTAWALALDRKSTRLN